ncbi:hypothetical protein FRC17_009728 [Serendipita sp. 399]|nr:hypothetical protein FRC17_009728 [Serendipita sp. 399]
MSRLRGAISPSLPLEVWWKILEDVINSGNLFTTTYEGDDWPKDAKELRRPHIDGVKFAEEQRRNLRAVCKGWKHFTDTVGRKLVPLELCAKNGDWSAIAVAAIANVWRVYGGPFTIVPRELDGITAQWRALRIPQRLITDVRRISLPHLYRLEICIRRYNDAYSPDRLIENLSHFPNITWLSLIIDHFFEWPPRSEVDEEKVTLPNLQVLYFSGAGNVELPYYRLRLPSLRYLAIIGDECKDALMLHGLIEAYGHTICGLYINLPLGYRGSTEQYLDNDDRIKFPPWSLAPNLTELEVGHKLRLNFYPLPPLHPLRIFGAWVCGGGSLSCWDWLKSAENLRVVLNPKHAEHSTGAAPGESHKVPARSRWIALADILTISGLIGLTLVSIITIVFTFIGYVDKWGSIPSAMTYLQTAIASLLLPIVSNALNLLGKRYVYAKIWDKGLRSRRIAIYSDCSVGNLSTQLTTARPEPLVVFILLVWSLGLATSLTVRESAKMVPLARKGVAVRLPVGSLDPEPLVPIYDTLVPITSATISSLASALASRVEGSLGYINVTNAYAGSVYYPPLLPLSSAPASSIPNIYNSSRNNEEPLGSFDTPDARLNGFKLNVSETTSIPSSAIDYNCTQKGAGFVSIWLVRATPNILSIAYTLWKDQWIVVEATPVILGGRLIAQRSMMAYGEVSRADSSTTTTSYTRFEANGTTWPLEMSDERWALQMMEIICTTTVVETAYSIGGSLLSMAYGINQRDRTSSDLAWKDGESGGENVESWRVQETERIWSTLLGTVVGAYSRNKFNSHGGSPVVYVDMQDAERRTLVPTYATYILVANTLVCLAVLFFTCKLFSASPLDRDFMDPTRLLLKPLEDEELFNASLDETIRILEDPHIRVSSSKRLLITRAQKDR